jgi:uncharacterized membrane protein YgcG
MTTKKKQSDVLPNLVEHLEQLTELSSAQETPFDVPETIAWSPTGAVNTKKNLATALAKAQAECQNVVMNKTNPHFRSRYADLSAVRDAVIPIFTKNGLSIIQCPSADAEMGFFLETRLIHISGEEMVWRFPLPGDVSKMQVIGSAISYARRYTLSAVAAVASEEDDDGNAAQGSNGGGSSGGGGSGGGTKAGGGASSAAGGIVL